MVDLSKYTVTIERNEGGYHIATVKEYPSIKIIEDSYKAAYDGLVDSITQLAATNEIDPADAIYSREAASYLKNRLPVNLEYDMKQSLVETGTYWESSLQRATERLEGRF
jgi:hypothetical protein